MTGIDYLVVYYVYKDRTKRKGAFMTWGDSYQTTT
jgi:hypothetical protein